MSERAAVSRARGWAVAAAATLAMSVSYGDRQVIAAVGASVRKALGIDAAAFGVLAGAFSMAYLVLAPVVGFVVDRIGARRGLLSALLLWSCVSAAHALVPGFAALLVLRLMLGAAEAPSFPAAAQSLQRTVPPSDRSAAFGLLFTGSSLGAAIVMPLAIYLDVHHGWRFAFLVSSVLGLAWVPLWLAVTNPPAVRALLSGAPPVAANPDAPSLGDTLRDPVVWRAMLMVVASAGGLMFVFVWMPQYLELGRGLPKASLPHYVWLPPLGADAGMLGFGALGSWRDRRVTSGRSHWELLGFAALLESTLVLLPLTPGPWSAVGVLALASAGCGGAYVLLTADMMARVPAARVAASGGITAAGQSIVYVLLNPLVGRWIDKSGSYDGAILLLGATPLPGAILWSLWKVGARTAASRAPS